ncbi:MAG TPA: pseudouridine synthase [Pseudomonadales bacterium]|jgi:tRNA pseudouridine32 synthase/23S rRNA pseudouridine746 synthase|nr:RNA pseudouridine synthase [Gammaproteobacteria bacterium]MDP6024546.1 pseudouridine synthase [Pseudomonadales bacterium]MDP6316590.1 pseudouridine synthase [Pseudomonadales bacterium]MDP7315985.1 pseudouridine synthase [Pseudomonadales bacterium]HJL60754.1 pseudouridine synthase [Pseudomonadales bacterium]|tara:strand:- start:212 stop:898 length:687 start_codon:yes stop_codon:yes gene_type:complete
MDEYTFHIPPECKDPVEVVYVDEHILVVDKPSGLLSVPGRIVKDCVKSRISYDYPDATIVHRLDLDTSGLLILSLSKLATIELNRQFRDRIIEKRYIADVFGRVSPDSGDIDFPIATDSANRPRQRIDLENGKQSLTRYEVLERSGDSTRLLLKPVTGRSHQLRIHLAHINHPILGCDLYAHAEAYSAADRLCLHAHELRILHPAGGQPRSFKSKVPFEKAKKKSSSE